MSALPHRPLGASGLEVSAFALGSWRTYERIPREEGVAVLQAGARERHRLPRGRPLQRRERHARRSRPATPRSSSARSSRPSGWPRDEVDDRRPSCGGSSGRADARRRSSTASLERTGLDRFDFVYSDPPPPELPMADVVGAGRRAGRRRPGAGVGHRQLAGRADRRGRARRRASGRRAAVRRAAALQPDRARLGRGPGDEAALLACGAKVVASYVLAGGILSGKYAAGAGGRMAGEVDAPRWEGAVRAAARAAGARRRGRHDAGRAGAARSRSEPRRRDGAVRRDRARADRARTSRPSRSREASPRASSRGCARSGCERWCTGTGPRTARSSSGSGCASR